MSLSSSSTDLDLPLGNRRYEARLVRSSDNQILTLVRDITEQARAEIALREGAQRYALASAAGAVGVWDWNFETNQLYIDTGLKSLLGFEDAEISTNPEDWGGAASAGHADRGRPDKGVPRWRQRRVQHRASDAAQGWQRQVVPFAWISHQS